VRRGLDQTGRASLAERSAALRGVAREARLRSFFLPFLRPPLEAQRHGEFFTGRRGRVRRGIDQTGRASLAERSAALRGVATLHAASRKARLRSFFLSFVCPPLEAQRHGEFFTGRRGRVRRGIDQTGRASLAERRRMVVSGAGSASAARLLRFGSAEARRTRAADVRLRCARHQPREGPGARARHARRARE
jgi:hypothetical protein